MFLGGQSNHKPLLSMIWWKPLKYSSVFYTATHIFNVRNVTYISLEGSLDSMMLLKWDHMNDATCFDGSCSRNLTRRSKTYSLGHFMAAENAWILFSGSMSSFLMKFNSLSVNSPSHGMFWKALKAEWVILECLASSAHFKRFPRTLVGRLALPIDFKAMRISSTRSLLSWPWHASPSLFSKNTSASEIGLRFSCFLKKETKIKEISETRTKLTNLKFCYNIVRSCYLFK